MTCSRLYQSFRIRHVPRLAGGKGHSPARASGYNLATHLERHRFERLASKRLRRKWIDFRADLVCSPSAMKNFQSNRQ
jgi:hypothetical protein